MIKCIHKTLKGGYIMKILIVEDDDVKMSMIYWILLDKNIDREWFFSVNSALDYISEHQNDVSGIILDLGLTTFVDSRDYDDLRGLDLVRELTRKEINIPILINSTTEIELEEIMSNHKNVKGQSIPRKGENWSQTVEWFLTTLQEGQ